MTHEEIKILISAYKDGEVTPSEKNIVEEHLCTCQFCQKDYTMYQAMSSSLSKWPNEALSPDEEIQVQRRFEQRRETMFTKRTVGIFTTTLCLALIVGSVLQTQHQKIIPSKVYAALAYQAPSSKPMQLALNIRRQEISEVTPEGGRGDQFLAGAKSESMQFAASPSLLKSEDVGLSVSEYANTRLGTGIVGMAREGAQTASYNAAYDNVGNNYQYNPYYTIPSNNPNYIPYYYNPYYQPTPVKPYRIQYAASNTEQYDRVYDNPFLAAKDDPLSTFSIDVDTGSYSNVRRFLMNGQKPPKDAVHIEELINYFSYDYPQPTDGDPFSITTEVSTCPWNPQHQLALIGLQGKKIPMENLPASNLVFLVDVSGSMGEDDKLPLVKSSLHLLVEQLRPQDTISIAVFSGSAARLLEPTSGRDKDKILNAVDGLEAGGSTNGEEGLQLAYRIAKENFISNGNNRIIVTTDGDFNVGTSDDADLIRMIEEKKDEGVYLSVFGFGMGNLKASRMEKLADSGHGNYDYIDSLDEARKEFVQQLGGTLYAIAKDVKIQVEFNPSTVKAYRLIGYEKRMLKSQDFNNDKKDAGVMGSGHAVTALYEITPADSKESVGNVDALRYQTTAVNPSTDLMTIKLRYKDPQSDTSKLIVRTLNKSQISQVPSENLRFAGSVAAFGMLLRDSEYKGTSSYLQVMDAAQKATGTDVNGYRKDFLDLIEKAGLLDHTSSS